MADWAGKKQDEEYGKDGLTATEGVKDAMKKVSAINAGIVGAVGAASAAKAAPVAAEIAMRNPDKIVAATNFASGQLAPGPPPPTGFGGIGG